MLFVHIFRFRKFIRISWFTGELPSNYILSSNRRIPRIVDNKIDELTSRIVEGGICDFFESTSRFLAKIRNIDPINDGTDFRRVTMKQFYFPFIIYLIAMMISILIFILEIIYFNFQNSRRVFPYVEWFSRKSNYFFFIFYFFPILTSNIISSQFQSIYLQQLKVSANVDFVFLDSHWSLTYWPHCYKYKIDGKFPLEIDEYQIIRRVFWVFY